MRRRGLSGWSFLTILLIWFVLNNRIVSLHGIHPLAQSAFQDNTPSGEEISLEAFRQPTIIRAPNSLTDDGVPSDVENNVKTLQSQTPTLILQYLLRMALAYTESTESLWDKPDKYSAPLFFVLCPAVKYLRHLFSCTPETVVPVRKVELAFGGGEIWFSIKPDRFLSRKLVKAMRATPCVSTLVPQKGKQRNLVPVVRLIVTRTWFYPLIRALEARGRPTEKGYIGASRAVPLTVDITGFVEDLKLCFRIADNLFHIAWSRRDIFDGRSGPLIRTRYRNVAGPFAKRIVDMYVLEAVLRRLPAQPFEYEDEWRQVAVSHTPKEPSVFKGLVSPCVLRIQYTPLENGANQNNKAVSAWCGSKCSESLFFFARVVNALTVAEASGGIVLTFAPRPRTERRRRLAWVHALVSWIGSGFGPASDAQDFSKRQETLFNRWIESVLPEINGGFRVSVCDDPNPAKGGSENEGRPSNAMDSAPPFADIIQKYIARSRELCREQKRGIWQLFWRVSCFWYTVPLRVFFTTSETAVPRHPDAFMTILFPFFEDDGPARLCVSVDPKDSEREVPLLPIALTRNGVMLLPGVWKTKKHRGRLVYAALDGMPIELD